MKAGSMAIAINSKSSHQRGKLVSPSVYRRAIPDYQSVEGNIDVYILERHEGEIAHFIALSLWENMNVIRGFAGEGVDIAKYYEEDKDFLLEFEPTVLHYEVVGRL